MVRASSGSVEVSRRTPRSDLPTRPPALILGPSAKPRSRHDRRLHQPRRLGQRRQADILPRRHDLEALGDERAVERLETRDVGYGAERDQIEQVEDLRLGARLRKCPRRAKLADQRDSEQERHADRGQMAVRRAVRALVETVGVDQRVRDRKQAGALVVIDDDHVEHRRAGFLERFVRLRAAVDADCDRSRRGPSVRPAPFPTGRSPPSAGRGYRRSARPRDGAAAASEAPRWSRRRRHNRRRSRPSRRPGPHRRAALRRHPCP